MLPNQKQTSAAKAAVEFHFNAFKSLVLSDFVNNLVSIAVKRKVVKAIPTVFWRALDKTQDRIINGSKTIPQELDIYMRLVQTTPDRRDRYVSTIMVETKTHLENLVDERKMSDYIGAANFSFISVPQVLILQAFEHIETIYPKLRHYIGICCYETGEIICMPKKRKTDNDRTSKLLAKFCTSAKVLPGGNPIYEEHTLDMTDDKDAGFVEFDGYVINEKYLSYIKDWHYINKRLLETMPKKSENN